MSNTGYLRVVYAYSYRISANHLPGYPQIQQGLSVILIPTMNSITLRECAKLCDIHGKHPAGAYGFIVLSREYIAQSDVSIDDNIIPYDDNPVEIC